MLGHQCSSTDQAFLKRVTVLNTNKRFVYILNFYTFKLTVVKYDLLTEYLKLFWFALFVNQ